MTNMHLAETYSQQLRRQSRRKTWRQVGVVLLVLAIGWAAVMLLERAR